MDIKDKVVVITGAASGMGAASARMLAENGAKVALFDLNLKATEALAKALDGLAVECDVASEDSALQAVAKVVKHFSSIHASIQCAGIAPAARAVGKEGPMPLDQFHKVLHVNLLGTFNVLRLTAAQMLKQDPINDDNERGVIINTASVAAYEGQIGQAAYSASKGGVVAMTLPLAREFSKFGVRVMTIAPGIINTPMMAAMPEDVQDGLNASVPYPNRMGKVTEYSALVKHIFENKYLNGSVIRLDGALRMSAK